MNLQEDRIAFRFPREMGHSDMEKGVSSKSDFGLITIVSHIVNFE
jgi:hypothetical protein